MQSLLLPHHAAAVRSEVKRVRRLVLAFTSSRYAVVALAWAELCSS